MDLVLAVVALLVLAVPVGLVTATWAVKGPEIVAAPFVPYRSEGWPRGVQEEDPSFESPWRLGPHSQPAEPAEPDDATPAPVPTLARVRRGPVRR